MNRFMPFILGPELYWLVVYIGVHWLVKINLPHTPEGARQLETIGWFVFIGSVILSFLPIMWTSGNRWWLLIRIGIAGFIGSICTIQYFIDEGFYPDPGIGMYGFILIGLSYALLLIGLIIGAII